MRWIIRLGVVVLAALGAKSLWDYFRVQTRRADRTGTDVPAGFPPPSASHRGAETTGLGRRIGHTARTSATDPNYSPMQKAEEVSAAFEADKNRAQ